MNSRQHSLLIKIIKEYSKNAVPVGSKFLARTPSFDVSSATIRNEMAELESLGYITHPHTSAGRIPTEKGYLYYLEHLTAGRVEEKDREKLKRAFTQEPGRAIQNLAKELAELTDLAVVVGFEDRRYFYSGISRLFTQPEFSDSAYITSLSGVIDAFDEVLYEIFETVTAQTQIFVGSQNPFGNGSSCLLVKFSHQGATGVIGIVGPLRMDYDRNRGLLESAQAIIQNKD